MGMRSEARRYLAVIERLARRRGGAQVDDLAQATGLSFGRACAITSTLGRDHLVRHVPRSGIFVTERGRALLKRQPA